MTYQMMATADNLNSTLSSEYVPMDDVSEAERWANLAGMGEPLYDSDESSAIRSIRDLSE